MMKRAQIPLIVFFLLSFDLAAQVFGREPVQIRVAVFKDVREATLAVKGPFDIVDARTRQLFYHGRDFSSSKVTAGEGGIRFRNMTFNTEGIEITGKRKAAILVNGRPYRGEIRIFKYPGGTLCVVNVLDLESYVKGVLYHEVSHKWPIDAIKAQAVASRTYAMYQREVMKGKDYDLTADTSSQVYGGYASEQHRTNRAANFTKDEVLTFRGRFFPAYFHATCGGMTENAGELWRIDLAPLKGERVCSFCQESPHYYWSTPIELKALQKKLGSSWKLKGQLKNISITQRNATGRVRTLELKDDKGARMSISAKDFRNLAGPDAIRSTNFSIVMEQNKAIFNGRGWGHGAGLCQWGAFGMSKKGYGYKEILAFYYPGAEIVKLP